jgi:hypothetical protein
MRINTLGSNVTFTPIVDNIAYSPTIFNTPVPTTVFHYFSTDIFGIDFSGELTTSDTAGFEFGGLLKPEEVQVLPVAKTFDQVGPIELDRLGKLIAFRVRGIFFTDSIPVTVYVEDTVAHTFTLLTAIGKDKTYEQMQMPKTLAGTTMRFEIGPSAAAFHRYDVSICIVQSGMKAGKDWIKLK